MISNRYASDRQIGAARRQVAQFPVSMRYLQDCCAIAVGVFAQILCGAPNRFDPPSRCARRLSWPGCPSGANAPGSIRNMRGILFFCHGARSATWRAPFDAIVAQLRHDCPSALVELAFLEMMTPDLLTAAQTLVAQGADQIDVVPLFLAPGSHTQRDLPELIAQARARWPTREFSVAPTLTESAPLRAAIVAAALAGTQAG
jgi:sirohydrochlorin cobaltochelatase